MIFLFAGHHNSDPGAINFGVTEADLNKELRGLVAANLDRIGGKYILDKDHETLPQLLKRIKPGNGSVICDLHKNASSNPGANGIEVIVSNSFSKNEYNLASDICELGSSILGVKNRGVKTEAQSARGKLAVLHTEGINVLVESFFMTNEYDFAQYVRNKNTYAKKLAYLLKHYDDLIL